MKPKKFSIILLASLMMVISSCGNISSTPSVTNGLESNDDDIVSPLSDSSLEDGEDSSSDNDLEDEPQNVNEDNQEDNLETNEPEIDEPYEIDQSLPLVQEIGCMVWKLQGMSDLVEEKIENGHIFESSSDLAIFDNDFTLDEDNGKQITFTTKISRLIKAKFYGLKNFFKNYNLLITMKIRVGSLGDQLELYSSSIENENLELEYIYLPYGMYYVISYDSGMVAIRKDVKISTYEILCEGTRFKSSL